MSRDWVNLSWGEKTWGERGQTIISWALAGTFGLVMIFVILMVLGQMIDVADQRREDHDRCLKNATNGYEVKQCR